MYEDTGSWVVDWAQETLAVDGWTVDVVGDDLVARRADVCLTLPRRYVAHLALHDRRLNLYFAVRHLARSHAALSDEPTAA